MTDQYKLCIRLPSCTCLFMHGLEEFSFSQYKKDRAKKSPRILKYKDTFFSATFPLHVFEAALFSPLLEHYSPFPEMIVQCVFQPTHYFTRSYRQLHLHRWEATYCYFHPLQLPPEQSSIRAKANDVDF